MKKHGDPVDEKSMYVGRITWMNDSENRAQEYVSRK